MQKESESDGDGNCLIAESSKSGKNNIGLFIFLNILMIAILAFYSFGVFANNSESSFFAATENFSGGADCWMYTANYSGCRSLNSTCLWGNNSGSVAEDPWCPINANNYNFVNMTIILPIRGNITHNASTGGLLVNSGCCIFKSGSSGSGGSGSFAPQGCWSFDRNQTGCLNSASSGISGCTWQPNNQNQNPMCNNNIGCCQQPGCWDYGGLQTASNNCTTVLGGICLYVASSSSCYAKGCGDMDTSGKCTQLSQLGQTCTWNGTTCNAISGGGFSFYDNNTDSCLSKGGWVNITSGGCIMPSGGGGGSGGFMFAQEARCWFADNKISICRNVTGCVYCNDTTKQITNASSACYNMQLGSCRGHESKYSNWNGSVSFPIVDINVSSMSCGDIRLKQTCTCGPLPNCVWNNASSDTGSYCISGIKTSDDMNACAPPVQFCEDPKAKNNQTLCNLLGENYMMPCKWDNTSTPNNNCTFNGAAVFGGGGGGSGTTDYSLISGETGCVAAGGSWKTEYYTDSDGSFKQDSWCEKGAMFSFTDGKAFGNKGSCDSDCWACEFNSTGGAWSNIGTASSACQNSKKGYCQWNNDTNAPNHFGRCDYPREMSFGGAKECSTDCKACEYFANAPQVCSASIVGCSWVNDTTASKGGFCLSSSKKSCSNDCFSCFDQSQCSNSTFHPAMNCSWDSSSNFCKPSGFTGEICFNGKDDDNDGKMDCADSKCSFDQFCGGGSMGGGGGVDCKKQFSNATCINSISSTGKNCTWVIPNFGGQGGQPYCDFPGSSCWLYENNAGACNVGIGCVYKNTTLNNQTFMPFCQINNSIANGCFGSNNTVCTLNSACQWVNDSFTMGGGGGRCEFKLYSLCGSKINQNTCNAAGNCTWRTNSFSSGGGFCEPSCFSLNSNACENLTLGGGSLCSLKRSTCEPELFSTASGGGGGMNGIGGGGTGCHVYDGNQAGCVSQNLTCGWMSFMQNVSQGVCNDKGQQSMLAGMDQSPPKILGNDPSDTLPREIDIREYGVKESGGSLSFGIVVTNITNAAVCKGYYIGGGFGGSQAKLGNGTMTTKFFLYLDTNKNTTDGCTAIVNSTANSTGYEFLIKYVSSLSGSEVIESKSFYKCSSGAWALTNVPLTSNRQFMCGMSMMDKTGGVMIAVDKQSLASFSTYNSTSPMRVLVISANDSTSESNPLDWVNNAGYYTQGSADFKFVDCGDPNVKDDKCKNFQKFGFNVFEDCKNGKDDDGDGFSDCDDSKCSYTPVCASGSAFNFVSNPNDHQSPVVVFSQVDALHNGAFIKFDSDEPANGTLDFYSNDSGCSSANMTINDVGNPSITFDNYKPFHGAGLDSDSLSYSLTNGTTYFYKTTVCDPSGNCASSACQNFTTKSENAYKNFIFKMKLSPGYNVTIPALNYNGNFTTLIGGKVYDVGLKTNASLTKNINVTVNCGTQALTFVGVDIYKPKSIDLTGAFVCDNTNKQLGMNSTSKSWNQVITDLSLGGAGDSIKLSFPVSYSSGNTIKWCNDDLSNCSTVNNYANCSSGGTSKTDCSIPTSLGFSAYQITIPSTDSGNTGGSSGGGGSGGGGGVVVNTTKNATTPITQPNTNTGSSAGEDTSGNTQGSNDTPNLSPPTKVSYPVIIWSIVAIIAVLAIAAIIYFAVRTSGLKRSSYR
ncbi:MAG: hypothetical protein Q7S74_05465 [Nanoarchaeota archaeon]|nr:hypothetical protein [Nanoarchaeota archaeon]